MFKKKSPIFLAALFFLLVVKSICAFNFHSIPFSFESQKKSLLIWPIAPSNEKKAIELSLGNSLQKVTQEKQGDWSTYLNIFSLVDNKKNLRLTVVKGSPFIFFTATQSTRPILSFSSDLKNHLFIENLTYPEIAYAVIEKDQQKYAVFVPMGSQWNLDHSLSLVSFPNQSIADKRYFSIALLPKSLNRKANEDPEIYQERLNKTIERNYLPFAFNFITQTAATAKIIRDQYAHKILVETTFNAEVEDVAHANHKAVDTLLGLLPYHYANLKKPTPDVIYDYKTPEGKISYIRGNVFKIILAYPSLLPWSPSLLRKDELQQKILLKKYLSDFQQIAPETKQVTHSMQAVDVLYNLYKIPEAKLLLEQQKKKMLAYLNDQKSDNLLGKSQYFLNTVGQIGLREKGSVWIKNHQKAINQWLKKLDYIPNLFALKDKKQFSDWDVYLGRPSAQNKKDLRQMLNTYAGLFLWGQAFESEEAQKIRDTGIYSYTTLFHALKGKTSKRSLMPIASLYEGEDKEENLMRYTSNHVFLNYGESSIKTTTSDALFSAVFEKKNKKTYMVYNPEKQAISGIFSDGQTFKNVPKNSMWITHSDEMPFHWDKKVTYTVGKRSIHLDWTQSHTSGGSGEGVFYVVTAEAKLYPYFFYINLLRRKTDTISQEEYAWVRIEPDTVYEVTIKAVDSENHEDEWKASIKTLWDGPFSWNPASVRHVEMPRGIKLSWDSGRSADYKPTYKITWEGKTGIIKGEQSYTTDELSYTIAHVEPDAGYLVTITAQENGKPFCNQYVETIHTPPFPTFNWNFDSVQYTTKKHEIDLHWDMATGGSGYTTYKVTWDGGEDITRFPVYSITDLTADTDYRVEVIAQLNGEDTKYKYQHTIHTESNPSFVWNPSSVQAVETEHQINLTWTAATGGSGKTSYKVTVDGHTYMTDQTHFEITGLEADTDYLVIIVAEDNGKPFADQYHQTLHTASYPVFFWNPSSVQAVETKHQINLAWTAATGGSGKTSYKITVGEDAFTTSETHYNMTALEANTDYHVTIVAEDDGIPFANKYDQTLRTARDAVFYWDSTSVQPTVTHDQIDLTWAAAIDGENTTYKITWNGDSHTTDQLNYHITGLLGGTDYEVTVTAENNGEPFADKYQHIIKTEPYSLLEAPEIAFSRKGGVGKLTFIKKASGGSGSDNYIYTLHLNRGGDRNRDITNEVRNANVISVDIPPVGEITVFVSVTDKKTNRTENSNSVTVP